MIKHYKIIKVQRTIKNYNTALLLEHTSSNSISQIRITLIFEVQICPPLTTVLYPILILQ